VCGPEEGYFELLTRLKASEMAPFMTKCTHDLTHVTSTNRHPLLLFHRTHSLTSHVFVSVTFCSPSLLWARIVLIDAATCYGLGS